MIFDQIFNKKQYFLRKAHHYLKNNDYSKAAEYFDNYLTLKPEDAHLLKDIANEFIKNSDHPNALNYLSLYLKYRPNDAYALKDRGFQYYLTDENKKALKDLDNSSNIKNNQKFRKKDVFLFESRAQIYKYLGEYEKALQDMNQAIEMEPDFVWLYEKRAEIYNKLDMTQKAEDDKRKTAIINKKNKTALDTCEVSKIIETTKQINFQEMSKTIEAALLKYPDNPKLLFFYAQINLSESYKFSLSGEFDSSYLQSGHYLLSRAVHAFKKVIEIDPDYNMAKAKLKESQKNLSTIQKFLK
ncbi:MAG: tetratricopeptide repeat protein [Pseudomonadota bacterium]